MMHVYLLGPDGEVLAYDDGWRFITLLVPQAPTGNYSAQVAIVDGAQNESFGGMLQIDALLKPTGAPHDLLPDLVALPLRDIRIERPPQTASEVDPVKEAAFQAAGYVGCTDYEIAQRGAKRCLRLTNTVGNVGAGRYEVQLSWEEGIKAMGRDGRFLQRVYRTDGTFADRPAGTAEYHPTHKHFHYAGLNEFAVFHYDLATRTRGAQVGTGAKVGMCTGSIEPVNPGEVGDSITANQRLGACSADAAEDVATGTSWSMGLNAGWADTYTWATDEQYVDFAGAEDGVYELVNTVNPAGGVLEADTRNNEASTVFRIEGDTVEVLSSVGYVPSVRHDQGAWDAFSP